MTALAKVLALCAGTVGGAAACVATGVVPAPLLDPPARHAAPPAKVAHQHRHRAEDLTTTASTDYEVAPPSETAAENEPQPQETAAPTGGEGHREADRARPDREAAPIEEAVAATPPSESGATEYTEAPPPSEATSSASASSAGGSTGSPAGGAASGGNAAGEFGP